MAVIYTFCSHDYFELPHVLVAEYLQLAHELLDVAPRHREIAEAVEALRVRVGKVEARVASLADRYDRDVENREVEFESFTDEIAQGIDSGFSTWPSFVSPELHAWLPPEETPELQAKLPRWHEKAARSRVLHVSMFGDDILDYFRLSYPKRFRMVAGMLRSLAEGDLGHKFDDLLGKEFTGSRVIARSAQYDQLVAEHLRERDETRSLAGARVAMRWQLARYKHEVLAALQFSDVPGDFELCESALEPSTRACEAKVKRPWPELDETEAAAETETPIQ